MLVSGDWKKMFTSIPAVKNIRFIDFVSGDEYEMLLSSVDGIMVLTGEEGCLNCGAYEAFSAGKPLILSRTEALQSYFGKAPIYTYNTSESILYALQRMKKEINGRAKMILQEQPVLNNKFKRGIRDLEKKLAGS
jgi:glycosyltransferase involved in cell wall biosynthesis